MRDNDCIKITQGRHKSKFYSPLRCKNRKPGYMYINLYSRRWIFALHYSGSECKRWKDREREREKQRCHAGASRGIGLACKWSRFCLLLFFLTYIWNISGCSQDSRNRSPEDRYREHAIEITHSRKIARWNWFHRGRAAIAARRPLINS